MSLIVKKIDIAKATRPLFEYAERIPEGPIVVTSRGRPLAVLVAVVEDELETISLSTNPSFIRIIEKSRVRAPHGGRDLSGRAEAALEA